MWKQYFLFILLINFLYSNVISDDTNIEQNMDEELIEEDDIEIDEDIQNRQSRLFFFQNSPMFSILNQSPATNYIPLDNRDPFDFLRDQYPLPFGFTAPLEVYDFVIIGGGTAGCTLASRLSENGKYTVLLLEAGGGEMSVISMPSIVPYFQSTNYNWGFLMEKQKGLCLAMENQQCAYPKGKGIGGSSLINYMIYTRGTANDWNSIATDGNPGWSWKDVLPYFLKSEKAGNLEGLEDTPNHNKHGLIPVQYSYRSELAKLFLEGALELGHNITDYNNGDEPNFAYVQTNTYSGKRISAAKGFLYPFRDRQNLHILPYSRVTKININTKTKTAKSVEYVRNKLYYKVKARKEIILSAGTLMSPQILMLSGVGPKNHLQELGIDVIQDLKVGENMYDHISFIELTFLVNKTGVSLVESQIDLTSLISWLNEGKGRVSSIGGVEALGYIKTKISKESRYIPDIEYIFAGAGVNSEKSRATVRGLRLTDWFFNTVYGDIIEKDVFTIIPMLLQPKSKGYIRLKDKNPFHWPKFYYDYFTDKRDLDTMVEGIKYAIKLSKTKALQSVGAKLNENHYPTCYEYEFSSDDYWRCALRSTATTLHHQIATCKMGPLSDTEAVVDHELRVYGIKKLRVVDASIIPKPLTAHTNAPSMMIAEKAADMIIKTWEEM